MIVPFIKLVPFSVRQQENQNDSFLHKLKHKTCFQHIYYKSNKSLHFPFPDASSSNEQVYLQQEIKTISTKLVTLRNHLHEAPANRNMVSNGPLDNATMTSGSAILAIRNANKINHKVNVRPLTVNNASFFRFRNKWDFEFA